MVYGKAPTRQLQHKSDNWTLSSTCRKSASKAVLSKMQLTLHATRATPRGALHLMQPMSAWSVKTGRAPSRHCRDARVLRSYDYCTAMHDMSTPPPEKPHPTITARALRISTRQVTYSINSSVICTSAFPDQTPRLSRRGRGW